MIIVTGCDNTGKTSLVRHLSKKFGIEQATRYTPLPPVDGDDWFKWAKQSIEDGKDKIFDRFLVDEFVYGPVKRDSYICSIEQLAILSQMIIVRRPLYIYTFTTPESILKSFTDRIQYPNPGDVNKLLHQFKMVNNQWPFNQLPRTRFNFLNDSEYSRIDRIVENFLNCKEI